MAQKSSKGLLIVLGAVAVAAVIGIAAWLLLPRYGSIIVDSVPQGAEWYIEDRRIGVTPGTFDKLEPGPYIIRIKAKGYKPWSQSLTVEANKPTSIKASLEQILYRLRVNPTPSSAQIKLLDSFEQYRPGMKLKPGKYRIEVSQEGYKTEKREVVIVDDDKAIDVSLEKQRYSLTVTASPSHASIRMPGSGSDYTPGIKLENGTYTIEVSASGYVTRKVRVTMSNSDKNLSVTLKKQAEALTATQMYAKAMLAAKNGDNRTALKWHARAAKQYKYAPSIYQIGEHFFYGRGIEKNRTKALSFYVVASNEGSFKGTMDAGTCYFSGIGTSKNYQKALYYYKKAAHWNIKSKRKGFAANRVGRMYHLGRGVPVDYSEAARWYKHGALNGSVSGVNNLAYMHYKGLGVAKDYTLSFKLFTIAAKAGNVPAMDWLATLYERGHGTSRSISQAIYWYRKAAQKGNASARQSLIRLTGSSI